MKFDEAVAELDHRLSDPTPAAAKVPAPANEAAGLAMLQAAMRQSDFKGATG